MFARCFNKSNTVAFFELCRFDSTTLYNIYAKIVE